MIRDKPLASLTREDLQNLVTGEVSEGRDLEYKRDLYGSSDDQRRELLADVTSLANASGGDLLIGVDESNGCASALPGVNAAYADNEILRLENIVRDAVEPRLLGLRSCWIDLGTGFSVLAIRVPSSLAAPHRVKFKGSARFFTRSSRGKYEMDTHELRSAFVSSEGLPDRFRALHNVSISHSLGTDMPFSVGSLPTAVASIAPLNLFREARDLEITEYMAQQPYVGGRSTVVSWMHTLEGVLVHTVPDSKDIVTGYTMTHRQGWVEAVWHIGGPRPINANTIVNLVIPNTFEAGLLDQAGAPISRLARLGVTGPWIVMTSVLNVRGYELTQEYSVSSAPAFRDQATLPELRVDRIDETSLKPILEAFWRVFGHKRPIDRKIV